MSQHYGDYQKLGSGTKFDPHATYHADGTYHVAAYKGNPVGGYPVNTKRQPLGPGFTGYERLIDQSFGRCYAKALGKRCQDYDHVLEVDAAKILDNSATFSVALLAPGTDDNAVIKKGQGEIARKLIQATSPWCLITVQNHE